MFNIIEQWGYTLRTLSTTVNSLTIYNQASHGLSVRRGDNHTGLGNLHSMNRLINDIKHPNILCEHGCGTLLISVISLPERKSDRRFRIDALTG